MVERIEESYVDNLDAKNPPDLSSSRTSTETFIDQINFYLGVRTLFCSSCLHEV